MQVQMCRLLNEGEIHASADVLSNEGEIRASADVLSNEGEIHASADVLSNEGEIHAWAELHVLILLGTCVTFAYEKRVGGGKSDTVQSHGCLQMMAWTQI